MASGGRAHLPADSRRPAQSSHNRFRREVLDSPVLARCANISATVSTTTSKKRSSSSPATSPNNGLLADGVDAVQAGQPRRRCALRRPRELRSVARKGARASTPSASPTSSNSAASWAPRWCMFRPATRRAPPTAIATKTTSRKTGARTGGKSFSLQREIRDALAAIERVEAESRDQLRHAEFRGDDADADAPRESIRRASAQAMGRGAAEGSWPRARANVGDGPTPTATPRASASSSCSRIANSQRHGRPAGGDRKRARAIRCPGGTRASTPVRR